MSENHIHFEKLCAMAASGELTAPEGAALREHCDRCAGCAQLAAEMNRVGDGLCWMYALEAPGRPAPRGMRDRFVVRAVREGIPLERRPSRLGGLSWQLVPAAALLLLVVCVASIHGRLGARSFRVQSSSASSWSGGVRDGAAPPTDSATDRTVRELRRVRSARRPADAPSRQPGGGLAPLPTPSLSAGHDSPMATATPHFTFERNPDPGPSFPYPVESMSLPKVPLLSVPFGSAASHWGDDSSLNRAELSSTAFASAALFDADRPLTGGYGKFRLPGVHRGVSGPQAPSSGSQLP